MSRRQGTTAIRRVAFIAIGLLIALALTVTITAEHSAAKRKAAEVTVKIKTGDQAALLTTQRLNLQIRATAPTTMRVKVRAGGNTNSFGGRWIRFNRARTKRVSIFLNRKGRERLSTCGAKVVKVISRFSRYRRGKQTKRATEKKQLAGSPKQCPPIIPGPPTAIDDTALTDEDTSTTVDVLANDSDPGGNPLSIVSVDDSGAAGSASIAGSRIKYDPNGRFEALNQGQSDSDSFTYTIEDGKGGRATATVKVDIEGVDDPPVAKDDNPLTDEDTARHVEVLANDMDHSGTSLTIISIDDSGTTGTASIAGTRVKYDPNGGFEALAEGQTGSDAFTYTIEDGKGGRATATVNVEIEGVDDPSKVSLTPELYPEYSPEISDYVTRCDGSPVQIEVEAGPGNTIDVDGQGATGGDFSTGVDLAANQGFSFTRDTGIAQQTHYVRCLPSDFPQWTFEKFAPAEQEWYMVAPGSGPYHIVFSGDGVPVWWFRDPEKPTGSDSKLLADGTFAWPTGLNGLNLRFEIRSIEGTLLNTLTTVGSDLDVHDIQLLPNGNYMLMTYAPRVETVDLTPYGGPTDTTVLDAELQEVEPDGTLVWSWNSNEHVGLEETGRWWGALATLGPAPYDAVHLNSADVTDDSVVISARHTDAVYKIDRATGDIVWKLGGTPTPESLTVIDDPFGGSPLGGQHDARIHPDGTLTVHDNGAFLGRPPRAVRYRIDENAGSATLLESVTDPDAPDAICCGSARRSDSGSWLVSWGGFGLTGHPVSEFTADGKRTFKLSFLPAGAFSYRAQPIPPGKLAAAELRQGMNSQFPR